MGVKKVHVVFKTHLDIGFTDLSQSVTDHYLERYIPAAMLCASAANRPGQPPVFIWTVGSYLIDLALRVYPKEKRGALDDAIRKGYITYHALPFTTHSELCDTSLFAAGLGITKRLDAVYGRKTIAAKMSDVPGHTLGIVGPMAESGIEYLHIGINSVACMPKVPPLFVWQNSAGQSILVNYCRSYGGLTEIEGHDEALCFVHSQDNMGPPSPEHLRREFAMLREKYPGAEICASTLDAFAAGLKSIRRKLPVVTDEIGDTWIHGAGTDPKKISALRALVRLSSAWDQDGTWAARNETLADGRDTRSAFLEELLLVCEHTWGLDTKKYLTDYMNWNRSDFDQARKRDQLEDTYGQTPGCEHYFDFGKAEFHQMHPSSVTWNTRSYSFFESSHEEQRQYLARAAKLLPGPLKEKAMEVITRPESEAFAFSGEAKPQPDQSSVCKAGLASINIGYQPDGSAVFSPAGQAGMLLSIGPVEYHEVGRQAYQGLASRFLCNLDEHKDWAMPDNFKPGLEYSDAPLASIAHRPDTDSTMCLAAGGLHWQGKYPKLPVDMSGCPSSFEASLLPLQEGKLLLQIWLRDKPANRKPEALFLPVAFPPLAKVQLQKIGTWLSPERVVQGGNGRCHVAQRIRASMPEGHGWLLEPLDTPLVVFSRPDLLDFTGPARFDQMYLALYNNLWGTNFKMWYEEDILCRVLITYERRTAL